MYCGSRVSRYRRRPFFMSSCILTPSYFFRISKIGTCSKGMAHDDGPKTAGNSHQTCAQSAGTAADLQWRRRVASAPPARRGRQEWLVHAHE